MTVNRRTWKVIALGYVVKTVLLGIAWLLVPDLPARSLDLARRTWTWAAGPPPAAAPHVPPAPNAPLVTAQ